MYYKLSEQKLI